MGYMLELGDSCYSIQNFILGGILLDISPVVLRLDLSGVIKHDFLLYIRWYTSPNEHFEYGYPHSNALLGFFTIKSQIRVLQAV